MADQGETTVKGTFTLSANGMEIPANLSELKVETRSQEIE